MKTFLLLCSMILVSTFCFSQERSSLIDLELWGGLPFIGGSLDHEGNETIKTKTPFSLGMGAIYNVFPGSNFSIVVLANAIFPKTFLHTIDGQKTAYKGNGISSLDMQFGVGYHLLGREGAFRLPLTFGFHFFIFNGSFEGIPGEKQLFYLYTYGFGTSAAVEYHINIVYFFFRLQGFLDFIYDVYDSHVTYAGRINGRDAYFFNDREFTAISAFFGLIPSTGIGIKLGGK
jgi:hypothetical protein